MKGLRRESLAALRARVRALEGEGELSLLAAVLRGDPRAGARALADRCERKVAALERERARLARLFTPYHERLAEAEPETDTERILIEELDEQTTLAAQLLVLLVRFLFASLVLTTGLILLSNALVTGRLVAMLDSILDRHQAPDRAER